MLVLSRRRDEGIVIGDNIVITVVDIRGDKVRLGIQAPTEIPVHRQEVYEAIQRESLRQNQESLIEKKVGSSGGDNTLPKYFSFQKLKGNYYDIINMGRYGIHIDNLI